MENFFKDSTSLEKAIQWRRDFHIHAQPGWLEFYSTGLIARELENLGYEIYQGNEIIEADKRLFLPSRDIIEENYKRAIAEGIDEKYIYQAKDGLTGVVGVLEGDLPGPVIAYRFDIDALEIQESNDDEHRPFKEGFISKYNGYSHMCGHDAHTAIGLLLAKYFSLNKNKIAGTIKLIFQPDEEKLSGANAMVAKGVVSDVDYLIGGHVGANVFEIGALGLNVHNILSVTRAEVEFFGRSTHSTGRPDQGRNALLGACVAITNLYAISRHGLGTSVINVGKIEGGNNYNIIADYTKFYLETRGVTQEINSYLQSRANEIIAGTARMYGLDYKIKIVTNVEGGENSEELIKLGYLASQKVPGIKRIVPEVKMNASEDFMVLSNKVKENGGKSLYVIHGTPVNGGHHSKEFDIDEEVMINASWFYASLYESILEEFGN